MELYIAAISTVTLLILLGYLVPRVWSLRGPKRDILLDTSALIDGRVLDIVKSGFLNNRLVIPQFVIAELQLLADGNDKLKRERARLGLDMVRELQDYQSSDVKVVSTLNDEAGLVDDKLVKLAKKTSAMLYTTDFNLNKVAQIEGIKVLNVNELAQSLRPVALPGEKREIKIIQKGSNKNQGVGYLDDGTMVVVEGAVRRVGKKVEVNVIRSLQTLAGRMVFAEIVNKRAGRTKRQPAHKTTKTRSSGKKASTKKVAAKSSG